MAAIAMLGGCVSLQTPITDFATDYNRVIADTRNEMILLNILRAQHREPLYYSSVSQIEGAIAIGAEANLDLSLVGDGNPATDNANTTKPSLGVSMSSEPSFTVVPLNSNDFVRGALTPVRPATIALLLQQGWREDILAPLLIERITCIAGAGDKGQSGGEATTSTGTNEITIENHPYTFAQSRLSRGSNPATSDTVVPAAIDLQDFAEIDIGISTDKRSQFLIELNGNDLADMLMAPNSSRYEIEQSGQAPEREGSPPGHIVSVERDDDVEITFAFPDRIQNALSGCAASESATLGRNGGTEVHIRSTQGIIYYLGEILRARYTPLVRDENGSTVLLFNLRQGSASAAVSVNYRGNRYYLDAHGGQSVPTAAYDDRSLQIISLINQLLALQTSTEDLNRISSTVRVR
ncbi:hypothetical protein [Parasphingopyxis lamellibrachiae]|uniref:hypothetical protein n=1 Tax=Parasphingopyxis lamellibrachiae TaxID=680125 RepID=UPI0011C06CB1|nr:hypothetical protein [Parasphingopyxis lamellibrachiae]